MVLLLVVYFSFLAVYTKGVFMLALSIQDFGDVHRGFDEISASGTRRLSSIFREILQVRHFFDCEEVGDRLSESSVIIYPSTWCLNPKVLNN
jgi:hypothetical protein